MEKENGGVLYCEGIPSSCCSHWWNSELFVPEIAHPVPWWGRRWPALYLKMRSWELSHRNLIDLGNQDIDWCLDCGMRGCLHPPVSRLNRTFEFRGVVMRDSKGYFFPTITFEAGSVVTGKRYLGDNNGDNNSRNEVAIIHRML